MAKLKPWFHVVTPREDLREASRSTPRSSRSTSMTSAKVEPARTTRSPSGSSSGPT